MALFSVEKNSSTGEYAISKRLITTAALVAAIVFPLSPLQEAAGVGPVERAAGAPEPPGAQAVAQRV